jgi:hypothetical protein
MTKPPPEEDSHIRIVAVTLDEERSGVPVPISSTKRAIAITTRRKKPVRAGGRR